MNEIQNQLAKGVPTSLVPAQAYPQHLRLAALAKHQIELLTLRAATLKSQLGKSAPSQLQQEVNQIQNLISQLQPQYENQKSICIALKLCILIEGQI